MSTGDTGILRGVNVITSVLLLCISSHTLGSHLPFSPATYAWQLGYYIINGCGVTVPKQDIWGPADVIRLTLTTMNPFPMHGGGGTPAILTIAGSDSGGGAGIQVSRTMKPHFSGSPY